MIKTSSKIYLAIMGIAFVALGIICLCNPGATLMSLSLFIGISTLVSGVSSLCLWARMRKMMPQSSSTLLAGILEIILGIIFLDNGWIIAAFLPIIFACWLIIEGIGLSIKSTDYKDAGFKFWWVSCLLGIAVAVLGFFALKQPLLIGGGIISALMGIALVLVGFVYIVCLFGINKFQKKHIEWVNDNIDEQ